MSDTNIRPIRFLLNGELQEVRHVDPTRTLLQYLREDAHCTGTKEGCAEGDCGACTVAVSERVGESGVQTRAINACIQFLPTLDGKAISTVEGLKRPDGHLHPAQQAMVDCHGSQCGFCTPGFVMSMYTMYENCRVAPERADVEDVLSGNLCRCTGYRPIFDAAQQMYDLPRIEVDRAALRTQLDQIAATDTLVLEHRGQHFYAPTTLAELARLRDEMPNARMLAGSTDVGLWVTKMHRELGDILYLGQVEELKRIEEVGDALVIGAGATLTDAYGEIAARYPELEELGRRFASMPIRNAGTLGGNVANGSPIGDSMPPLIAMGARVVLRKGSVTRTLPLEDLYLAYQKTAMQPGEFVQAVEVPLPCAPGKSGVKLGVYKLSKRFDQDISAVCAAFALRIENGRVQEARIAFGGMAATPKRATATEAALTGQAWTEATVRIAMDTLTEDYQPLSDMRATAEYRMKGAQNLLYRYWLEGTTTRPQTVLAYAAAC